MRWPYFYPIVASVLLAACGSFEDNPPAEAGELGRGDFRYSCIGDADPYCVGTSPTSFPTAFAVGAIFGLEYHAEDSEDDPLPRVIAGSNTSVNTVGPGFAITRPGYTVFLAMSNFGEVYDFRHVYAAPVQRIPLTTGRSDELLDLTLGAGETLQLFAQPEDGLRTLLGGSLAYAWSSDDPTVARIASADQDRDVTIEGVQAGTTTLRVEAGGYVQAIEVRVGGDPSDADTSSEEEGTTERTPPGESESGDGSGSSESDGTVGDGSTGEGDDLGTTGGG